jgi:DNA polymerase-3 subunit epsilon
MDNLIGINGLRKSWTKHRQLKRPWQAHTYIAIDIETTGLDPINDQILSIAWVPVKPPMILIGEAQYHEFCIGSDVDLQQSPTIHGLTKAQLSSGGDVKKVLKDLEDKLYGCVMVCHHRSLDWSYLRYNRLTKNLHFEPLGVFDTLSYEKNKMSFDNDCQLNNSRLTLSACRSKYGLPNYTSHHALDDAIACAELFLAQATKIKPFNEKLGFLLKQSR